jgi:hypothetical protein
VHDFIFKLPMLLAGYGFGASFVALFMQLGGAMLFCAAIFVALGASNVSYERNSEIFFIFNFLLIFRFQAEEYLLR